MHVQYVVSGNPNLVCIENFWEGSFVCSLQNTNTIQTQNLKTFGDALSCWVVGQNVILSRSVANSLSAFPGKYCVQYKLILN